MEERTAIDMSDLLAEVQVPDMDGTLNLLAKGREQSRVSEKDKCLFGAKKRSAWDKDNEARCDFYPKTKLVHRAGVWFFALWQKSPMGRTLTDIKSDETEVKHFAKETASLIREVVGQHLDKGSWCIVTTPKRRHLTRNFATLIADEIGILLGIPFYEDVAICKSRHRVNAEFELQLLPSEPNIIVFDDFVTTGSTLRSMKLLLEQYDKNLMLFSGINNKM